MYDIIIIGGGISGLYCALKLSKKYKLLLLDERNYLGGRIHTHKHSQYEIGAARYHNKHKHLSNLINKYKLSKYPISKNIDYLDTNYGYIPNAKTFFNNAISDILQKSKKLNTLYLQSITFETLCEKYYSKDDVKLLINIFGYKTEFINLNAYDACRTFLNDFGNNQYYVIGEGMQTLCDKMVDTIINNNGTILKNKIVTNVLLQDGDAYLVKTKFQTYLSKKIIFAIKPHQMKQFQILKPIFHNINSVGAAQLLRIYAKFPINTNGVWFKNMNRTTTNSFLRHIIPISAETGLIMISYTDDVDVDKFLKKKFLLKSTNEIKKIILDECNKIFPDKIITKPTYFKCHYWSRGTHYWKIKYDSNKISNEMINPIKNIYTCGEGFSKMQGWIEGALKSAQLVINKLLI